MSQIKKIPPTVSSFAPLPVTQRGFGIHLHGTTKGSARLVYGNGTNVVIRYLDDPGRSDVFNGHKENVRVAKFSPNGEWIASGDAHGTVMVWAAGGDHIVKNTVMCCQGILDIEWSGDNQRIMAGGDGGGGFFGKVFMWNSSNSIGQITNNSKKILSVAFKPNRPFRIATVSEENQMCFYEGPPFKFSKSNKSHTNFPNCVRYNADGSLFASCGSDKKIVIYDGKTGDVVKEFEGCHEGFIYSLSWNPEGDKLLTCSGDKTAKIWNVSDGSVATEFTFPDKIANMQVSCLWLGEELVTVSLSGEINFLDVANPSKPKKIWSGHKTTIDSLDVSPDGSNIFTGDREGRIASWECKSGEAEIFSGEGHQGGEEDRGSPVTALAVSSDGAKLFSVGSDDKLYVSDIGSKKTSDQWMATEGQPTCLAAAHTEAGLCVVGTSRGFLHVSENGKEKQKIALGFVPSCAAFSPDDSELCVGAQDKKLAVTFSRSGFDFTKSADITTEILAEVTVCTYSNDGKFLTICDKARRVFLFARPGNELTKDTRNGWQFHQARISGVAWTKDSGKLLTSSADESVLMWGCAKEGKKKKRVKTDPAHLQGVSVLKVLDDARHVTVGADRYVRIWDTPSI